jgi:hypothetical protein
MASTIARSSEFLESAHPLASSRSPNRLPTAASADDACPDNIIINGFETWLCLSSLEEQ